MFEKFWGEKKRETQTNVFSFFFGKDKTSISTYCHEKLPVMPSLRRSRNERCRLGPEPTGGIALAATLFGDVDDDDVILLKMDIAVGLPDVEVAYGAGECCCCANGLSSLTESNDDSSGKNVLMAVPLPPLILQLAAEPPPIILLIVYFLRVWWLGDSLNEPCFGEQSRDDDILFACVFYPMMMIVLIDWLERFLAYFFHKNE